MMTINTNFTRRRFLHASSVALAGPLIESIVPKTAKGSTSKVVKPVELKFTTPRGKDPGHKMIIIYMQGGLSNFDTFDPKTNATIKGPFERIDTEAKDIKFTEILQPLAKHGQNFVVINNLYSDETDHDRGAALSLTTKRDIVGGSFYSPAVYQNPFVDFAELLNREASGDVGYIVLHQSTIDSYGYNRDWEKPWGAIKHDEPATVYSAYSTGSGNFINPFSNNASIPISRYRESLKLLEAFELSNNKLTGDSVEKHERSYKQAKSLLDGDLSKSFDLSAEPLKIRERYGDSKIGKQLLLARRMLERGGRVVVANDGNYDHHYGIDKNMEVMVKPFAKALDALIEDIKLRFDEKIFIAIITEFGRTPKLNSGGTQLIGSKLVQQTPGRDHWANAFGMVLICNDKDEINGGRTIGRTNDKGEIVGTAFPSSVTADTLLNLLKIGRFEKRGEVTTSIRNPYIDILNARLAS